MLRSRKLPAVGCVLADSSRAHTSAGACTEPCLTLTKTCCISICHVVDHPDWEDATVMTAGPVSRNSSAPQHEHLRHSNSKAALVPSKSAVLPGKQYATAPEAQRPDQVMTEHLSQPHHHICDHGMSTVEQC